MKILFFIPFVFNNNIFTSQDLSDPSTFLIYIYYESPTMKCQSCTYFMSQLGLITEMPIKTINYFTDPKLASRFLVLRFPCFVVQHEGKHYSLPQTNIDELKRCLNSKSWYKTQIPTNMLIIRIYSNLMYISFISFQWVNAILKYIPNVVLSIGIGIIGTYIILSMCENLNK
ncbi:hypothetical protein TCON_0256 [Astathelohania contejeani]|uniref:Thioredoxin domain-containing protein n=1 Tax=Astathelohania contejeani TaxID=164912 RepID=A0ABQ7I260_9MICR|nr:hypothetical protein TCON_0256 [Thelohania contejeani]